MAQSASGSTPTASRSSALLFPDASSTPSHRGWRPFWAVLLALTPLLSSGCTLFDSPQNIFSPKGTVAEDQKFLFFVTMWPALAVLILVEGAILYICFRYRRRKTDTGLPAQVHGNNKLEVAWTIAPAILLAFFVVPMISGIVDLGGTPKDAITVDVTGVQWAWQFAYQDPKGGAPLDGNFGDPLHVPIDRNIAVRLHSDNVIHSFWAPRLAGKTDVIPGRTNHMWFKGTEIGTYSGQCAEFCGLAHADMRFQVVVESQDDYDAFVNQLVAARDGEPLPLVREGD